MSSSRDKGWLATALLVLGKRSGERRDTRRVPRRTSRPSMEPLEGRLCMSVAGYWFVDGNAHDVETISQSGNNLKVSNVFGFRFSVSQRRASR